MSNFALDTSSSQADVISSLNYALANLNSSGLIVNSSTGQIINPGTATTVGYLYQYINVKYANSATGSSDFSSNSANKSYYGLRNTANTTISSNPVDYSWYQVAGGFGTTKSLWYQTGGGRQIYFTPSTAAPNVFNLSVLDDTPINLDIVTTLTANANITSVYTTNIFQRANTQPATPTGGTYNFGSLILTPPTGWSGNVPSTGYGNIWSSTNTFRSNVTISPPALAWTTPSLFAANGQPGNTSVSTFNFPAYTRANAQPATPLANTGSWNFSTATGTPPLDPGAFQQPVGFVFPSDSTVRFWSNSSSAYQYYTIFADTTTPGPGTNLPGYPNSNGSGGVYYREFQVTGNTAYVDMLVIGSGGPGSDSQSSGYLNTPGGDAGQVILYSNVALTTGNYQVGVGRNASTTIQAKSGGTFNPVPLAAALAGNTAVNSAGNGSAYLGQPMISGNYGPYNGGGGTADPWNAITWAGQIAGNGVAFFGGGGGAGSFHISSPGTGGLGGGGQGGYISPTVAGTPGTAFGAGGGGGDGGAVTYGIGYTGAIVMRVRQQANISTWSLTPPVGTAQLYSSFTVANTTNIYGNVTNLSWTTPYADGPIGSTGSRGFVPLAYVLTTGDPTFYTNSQFTAAFSAPRTGTTPPIGTGYNPISGDTAQFFYSNLSLPSGGISAFRTYDGTTWGNVNGQVIDGNVLVSGTITANKLAANDIYALNIQSTNATFGNNSSAGFWLSSANGDARFGGNVSIGANLNVQGLITGGGLNSNVVYGNTIVYNTITNNNIQSNTITGNNIQANTIQGNNIVKATITGNLIAQNTLTGNLVAQNTLTGNLIVPGTITGNLITANTIQGDSIVAGSITTTQLAADALIVGNIVSTGATFNSFTSGGYWLNNVSGAARFGGTLSIGNNLTVGNNAVIGGNLFIGDNAVIGGNLNVVGLITGGGLNANVVSANNIVPNSVSVTGANSVNATYSFSSPTANVYYPTGSNVSVVCSQTNNNFLISYTTGPNIIFSGASGAAYDYILRSRVAVRQPDNTIVYTGVTSTPVIGSDYFTTVFWRNVVAQFLSTTFTQTGTYQFWVESAWSPDNSVNNPTSLVVVGTGLTITVLNR